MVYQVKMGNINHPKDSITPTPLQAAVLMKVHQQWKTQINVFSKQWQSYEAHFINKNGCPT